MASINDTFNSRKTTPFERRGARPDALDTKTTTPFERRGARHETSYEVDTSELDAVRSEPGTEPQTPIRWMIVVACAGVLVGTAIWGIWIGF